MATPQGVSPQDAVLSWLDEYGAEKVSPAYVMCDRHARIPEKVALFYEDATGKDLKFTYNELRLLSAKMAGFLKSAGIEKGDRVAVMLPKCPELVIAALGIWRLGAVYVPLFTAFGPDAINHRAGDAGVKLVITNTANRSKLENYASGNIATVTGSQDEGLETGDYSFWAEVDRSEPVEEPVTVSGEDLLIILYTSGTTGNPKGVEIPVKALASFMAYMKFGLDLREEDMYWNLADPGWAYGLYYNLIGPLLMGKGTLFYNAPFKPEDFYKIVEKYRVTNFAGAPTAYRAIMAAGDDLARKTHIYLRVASSAGEPLNPKLISWAEDVWGIPIYDHFGQTELGMAVNNHHMPELEGRIKPGSMGTSMPGFRMTAVNMKGEEVGPGEEGELAVDMENSPLCWFRRYWNDEERTRQRFTPDGKYCLAGDTVTVDEDGYFFFSGRSDDIILSAGYRIGPFEVENALMQHPAVAECAITGKPDELRGELVQAHVVLKPDFSPSDELADELSKFVKTHLSAHQYPREIYFIDQLPKTPSGKVQRFLLKE